MSKVTVVVRIDDGGNLGLVGATAPIRLVVIDESVEPGVVDISHLEAGGMVLPELHQHVCDELAEEVASGSLDLLELNEALEIEKTQ